MVVSVKLCTLAMSMGQILGRCPFLSSSSPLQLLSTPQDSCPLPLPFLL